MKSRVNIAALIASALVAPLAYLELRSTSNYSNFPIPLFIVLWVIPTAFVLVAMPLARAMVNAQNPIERPAIISARLVFLALAALFWTMVVIDQWPCFMGVPDCD